jgi:CSLREA domain-containing protein
MAREPEHGRRERRRRKRRERRGSPADRPAVLEELEPRILLSTLTGSYESSLAGDPVALGVLVAEVDATESSSGDASTDATAVDAAERERHELVFVDTGVEGYQKLVDDLRSSNPEGIRLEVILLDSQRDGIDQITDALRDYQGLDAIHVVSHGSEGAVQLGDAWLSGDTLSGYQDDLASWADALSEEADLLFYGCDLAGGESGEALVGSIAKLTGADVAASTDLTGSALLGGDWELEVTSGDVETSVAFSAEARQSWEEVLSAFVVNSFDDTVDATPGDGLAEDAAGNTTLRAAIEEANALAGADSISLAAGTFTLGLGEITISSDLTITGAGAGATIIDGASLSRIFNITSGTVTISDLTITNGDAGAGNGGGIQVGSSATVNLVDVALTGNTGFFGGAIVNAGALDLTNVTIANNTATSDAGGIWSQGNFSSLNATNVTISGNATPGLGGGLYVTKNATLTNVTITNNSASQGAGIYETGGAPNATVTNSIIAGNLDTLFNPAADVFGDFVSGGNNIIGDVGSATGFTDGVNNDQVGDSGTPIDPMLDVLADNGGSTQTHALLAGSPAIDAANDALAPVTDQNGNTRDGAADIGAYEYTLTAVSHNLVVTTTADTNDGDTSSAEALNANKGVDNAISLREAIIAANNSAETVTISFNITDPLVGGAHTFTIGAGGLPAITDTVIIDGTTDPDYAGTPMIVLDGSAAGAGVDGIVLAAGSDGSTIRGLVINQFGNEGIWINGSSGNLIAGNYIGTDVSGTLDRGNASEGIKISGGASNNVIGGATSADRNVISG